MKHSVERLGKDCLCDTSCAKSEKKDIMAMAEDDIKAHVHTFSMRSCWHDMWTHSFT